MIKFPQFLGKISTMNKNKREKLDYNSVKFFDETATKPKAATTKPKAATTKPKAATTKPKAATTKPKAPTTKPTPNEK